MSQKNISSYYFCDFYSTYLNSSERSELRNKLYVADYTVKICKQKNPAYIIHTE